MFFSSPHRCPPNMSVNVIGVCGCNLDQIAFMNGVSVTCCPEGSALDNGMTCVDNCPATRPFRSKSGRCRCDLTSQTTFITNADNDVLCCPEGQVNDGEACADTCTPGTTANADGVCGK